MSWFWRGAQSAVFYYLSCTPWFVYVNERKREKERSRAKAAKSTEEGDDGTYVHPLASDTNPYWNEEMMMGPGLKRGRASKEKAKEPTKRLNTGGENSSAGDNGLSQFPSLEGVEELTIDEDWNKKRYQRADEHLWGTDDPSCVSYASLSSRAANKPLVSGDGAYYNAHNPAVRELHPPIISTRPKHPSQALWMTQPPPPAKLMEGKERADRSRSVSNASFASGQGTGGALAGRHASLRRVPEQFELPENMDPSPPEDDGMKGDGHANEKSQNTNMTKRGLLHPNDVPLSRESNGRPQTSTSLHVPLTSGKYDPMEARSGNLVSSFGQDTGNFRSASTLKPMSATESSLLPDYDDHMLDYGFPINKQTKEKHIPAQRWSMDI